MTSNNAQTQKDNENKRYPARYHAIKGDSRDNLRCSFWSDETRWIEMFNKPNWWIEDSGHYDFLSYLGKAPEKKDGKIGLSYLHAHLLSLYRNIETLM